MIIWSQERQKYKQMDVHKIQKKREKYRASVKKVHTNVNRVNTMWGGLHKHCIEIAQIKKLCFSVSFLNPEWHRFGACGLLAAWIRLMSLAGKKQPVIPLPQTLWASQSVGEGAAQCDVVLQGVGLVNFDSPLSNQCHIPAQTHNKLRCLNVACHYYVDWKLEGG